MMDLQAAKMLLLCHAWISEASMLSCPSPWSRDGKLVTVHVFWMLVSFIPGYCPCWKDSRGVLNAWGPHLYPFPDARPGRIPTSIFPYNLSTVVFYPTCVCSLLPSQKQIIAMLNKAFQVRETFHVVPHDRRTKPRSLQMFHLFLMKNFILKQQEQCNSFPVEIHSSLSVL